MAKNEIMEEVRKIEPHVPYVVFIKVDEGAFSNLRRSAKSLDPGSTGNIDTKVLVVSAYGDELAKWTSRKKSAIKAIQSFRLYQKSEINEWSRRHIEGKGSTKLRRSTGRMHSQVLNADSQEPR